MTNTNLLLDNIALYQAALEGLELQKQRVEDQIRQVREVLSGSRVAAPQSEAAPAAAPSKKEKKVKAVPSAGKKRKRTLSEEARTRIAEAQKKRWETFRAAQNK